MPLPRRAVIVLLDDDALTTGNVPRAFSVEFIGRRRTATLTLLLLLLLGRGGEVEPGVAVVVTGIVEIVVLCFHCIDSSIVTSIDCVVW